MTATEPLTEGKVLRAYPNPVETEANISYEVPQRGKVLLQLYDLMGRPIQTLVNQTQSAGMYETIWQAQGLRQGIYILDFQIDGTSIVKKKMLKN